MNKVIQAVDTKEDLSKDFKTLEIMSEYILVTLKNKSNSTNKILLDKRK